MTVLRRSARWLVLFALFAIAGEALLRATCGLGRPLLYVADAAAGYIPLPNQRLRRFGAAININEFGMRSRSVSALPAPNHVRILFVGDSVTFGTTYVDQAQIFTERLQADVPAWHGRSVEILNASAGGWATANELGYLRERGCFGAELVVLVLNTYDLDQPFASFDASASFPRSNPRLALGELWSRYIVPRVGLGNVASDPGATPELAPDAGIASEVMDNVTAMRQLAAKAGARFALVYSPTLQPQVNNAAWLMQVEKLRHWATAAHVQMIDLGLAFSAHPTSTVYFDGIHLRPLGHQLAEKAIASHLNNGLLDS